MEVRKNKQKKDNKVLKFIDFFSGIGGFRLGMEKANHVCVGHCEIDKFADRSYRAMHNVKEVELYAKDIRTIKPTDLPSADCYTGGFPCQAFSIAGDRGGFQDTRGTLFFEVLRLARERKPKYLFLENVKGLLSHDNGRTFATILTSLWQCGYNVQWSVCNSKYYGVPQNRERLYIIGTLGTECFRPILPIRNSSKSLNVLQECKIQTVGTITAKTGTAHAVGTYIINDSKQLQEKRIKYHINGGGQARRLFDITGISCTITSADQGYYAIPKKGVAIDEKDFLKRYAVRRLTPLECFRLQGFPDELFYKAKAVNSDSQLYKQIGNSVTVNVIYEIAKKL